MQQEITDQLEWLDSLEIGVLDGSEREDVVGVLSRGMRDNPLHVALLGENRKIRERRLRALLVAAFAPTDVSHALVARGEDGAIAGVCGMSAPCGCPPSFGREVLQKGLWPDREGRPWQLGPLVVDAHLQEMGVEGRLMQVACARVDAAHGDAYLETDKEIYVRLYERFGFEVVGVEVVSGVPNYLMLRGVERRQHASTEEGRRRD